MNSQLQQQKFEMQSNSNFLPSINQMGQFDAPRSPRSPFNNNSNNSNSHANNNNSKLENRIFYVEKAVARLIHAFESIGGRMNKLEADSSASNSNIATLSKGVKDVTDSNKEFVSKQHLITERLVTDIHKQQHQFTQQTAFINKELSDVRDSLQILSSSLQKNFNESIKAAMTQCNDLNVQNSNNLTSLRKITDQKISHLQQLMVEMQKRAQTQNTSILDIINSNQKNQTEFQQSFKLFFEKYRDSMHANLTSLQESSQEQISYLDNILRAEIKGRISATQETQKQIDAKVFEIQEVINQAQRDNKRSWEYINKSVESVQETQKHQQTANQPLHKIITNLTQQFDEMSQQQLTDIKSVMHLNQDTSEKQFSQIKNLQLQIQNIYSKLSAQECTQTALNGGYAAAAFSSTAFSPPQVSYTTMKKLPMERPQSYRSEMSSTAAFDAIKYHLSTMPHKADDQDGNVDVERDEAAGGNGDFEDLMQEQLQQEDQQARVAEIQSPAPQVQRQYSQFQQLSEPASPTQTEPNRPERIPVEQSQSEQQYEDEFGTQVETANETDDANEAASNVQTNESVDVKANDTVSTNENEPDNFSSEPNNESNLRLEEEEQHEEEANVEYEEEEEQHEEEANVENDEYEEEYDDDDADADEAVENAESEKKADADEENATNDDDLDIDDMLQDNEDNEDNGEANELESPQNADLYDGDENDKASTDDVQQEVLQDDADGANNGNENYSEEYGDGDKFEEDANEVTKDATNGDDANESVQLS